LKVVVVIVLTVCLWLLVCAICDLKWREVPLTLTLPPLFGALLWQAVKGNFALALFTILLFILADCPARSRGFANGLQATIYFLGVATSPEPVLAGFSMFAMLVIWMIWNLGKMGGADAQVLMALTLCFGPAVLLPIALAGGIQGLAALLMRKRTLPFMVSILAGTGMYFLANQSSLF
jgi:Flp pilus assembly protein protease CpaA